MGMVEDNMELEIMKLKAENARLKEGLREITNLVYNGCGGKTCRGIASETLKESEEHNGRL